VIVVIGFYVVQWNADALLKFSVIVGSSLVATMGLHDLIVRRTNVTRFLFGMKSKARMAV
jgi:glucan biosynthesis protein C